MSGTEKNHCDFRSALTAVLLCGESVAAARPLLLGQPHGSQAGSVLWTGPSNPILPQRVKPKL